MKGDLLGAPLVKLWGKAGIECTPKKEATRPALQSTTRSLRSLDTFTPSLHRFTAPLVMPTESAFARQLTPPPSLGLLVSEFQ